MNIFKKINKNLYLFIFLLFILLDSLYMTKKRLKHSKFKNTGILFELLVKQITADILSGKEESHANVLLSKFFKESSALGKEKTLYDLMLQEKAKSPTDADRLIDLILKSRKKISNRQLAEDKYNLIKEIKGIYPIDEFFKSPISDYKEMASIYKLFEDVSSDYDDSDPKEIFQARNCLLEHITRTKRVIDKTNSDDKDSLLEYYKSQYEDVRLLSYQLLVNKFNDKYKDLDVDQKVLLKEYINNVSNTNSLKKHVDSEVDKVKRELSNLSSRIKEPTVKIKVNETVNQLEKIKVGKVVKDSHVSALLSCYELIKEIKTNILL